MEAVKILYVAQEIFPYLPETQVSKICREMPQSVQESGREIRIFMPKYGCINERRNQLHEVIRLSGMNLIIDDSDHQLIIKVASIPSARMQVYFIDNEDYFRRKALVSDEHGVEFADNGDRAVFFARGVLETVKKLRWTPDIVHCHGWMTAFVPVYLKKVFSECPFFEHSKVVYSAYDTVYKKPLDAGLAKRALMEGLSLDNFSAISSGASCQQLTQLAIDYADGVVQGSEALPFDLENMAKKSQKLYLPYTSAENYVPSCNQFYDQVLGR